MTKRKHPYPNQSQHVLADVRAEFPDIMQPDLSELDQKLIALTELTDTEELLVRELEACIPEKIEIDWQCYAQNVVDIIRRRFGGLDYETYRSVELLDTIKHGVKTNTQTKLAETILLGRAIRGEEK